MKRLALTLLLCALASQAPAQGWRLRLDAAAQRVSFHGITADSVAESATHVNSRGGIESADGFAVDCVGDGYCRFYRPGSILTGVPFSVGADLTLWGLGVTGLSVHVNARAISDLTGDRLWPGTSPLLRLVEGYAEYNHDRLTVTGGRMLERGRLASAGSSGLDGIRGTWRWDRGGVEVGGYAGWGMARGTILPITSPAVDPLADFQPSSRQVVVGLVAGAHLNRTDVQAEYRRELDPTTHYIVVERAAVTTQFRPERRLRLLAAADYDLAQAHVGSVDVSATFTEARISGTIAARHYQPFFDLWTVWGAFSPVPFNGVSAALTVNPTLKLQLRSRAEWFKYDAAGTSAPEVTLADRGWRWSVEGTFAPVEQWSLELDTHGERQPGASSSGIDGRVTWHPRGALDLSVSGGSLARPLELRFQDAAVTYAGASAAYRVGERWRVDVAMDRYWESRDRPDASAFDWNQWRLSARVALTLRSSADRWLPPARTVSTP